MQKLVYIKLKTKAFFSSEQRGPLTVKKKKVFIWHLKHQRTPIQSHLEKYSSMYAQCRVRQVSHAMMLNNLVITFSVIRWSWVIIDSFGKAPPRTWFLIRIKMLSGPTGETREAFYFHHYHFSQARSPFRKRCVDFFSNLHKEKASLLN